MSKTSTSTTGIAEACTLAGSQRSLAIVLDVSDAAISLWALQGWVPVARAAEIEEMFGISRERLIDPALLKAVTPSARTSRVSLPLDLEL